MSDTRMCIYQVYYAASYRAVYRVFGLALSLAFVHQYTVGRTVRIRFDEHRSSGGSGCARTATYVIQVRGTVHVLPRGTVHVLPSFL